MDVIKIDQLSPAALAGALDPSLAFNVTYTQHRDLIAQSAIAGLQGVQDILSQTGIYGQAIDGLQESSSLIYDANTLAQQDPFTTASSSQTTGVVNALHASQQSQTSAIGNTYANPARDHANTAANTSNAVATGASNSEIAAANEVKTAAQAVADANNAFAAGNKSQVDAAYSAALTAQSHALTALNSLPGNASTARRNAAQAVYNAATEAVNAGKKVQDLKNSLMGQITGTTPTSSDLGNGYTLSTWGTTGISSITDTSGAGVLISADGKVDPLDGSSGWQFSNTSTFVLPGDTKVTFTPGGSASLLVSRGIHAFTVDNLQSGSTPNLSDYESLNGRVVDRASNDGYIFNMGGGAGSWSLNSSALGGLASRESVATSPLTNELKLDPTDVAISPDLQKLITKMGISPDDYDYDGDGKLNNEELSLVAKDITSYIQTMQDQYEQALGRLAAANAALSDLNDLLEILRKQNDKYVENRANDSASAKGELAAVEKRLLSALQSLRGTPSETAGDIQGSAEEVLQQLTSITHQGGVKPATTTDGGTPTTPTTPPTQGTGTTTPSTALESLGQGSKGGDALGDSLRRAGRLLSGFLGGANLNILELPTTPPTTDATGTAPTGTAPTDGTATGSPPSITDLASALTDLVGQLTAALADSAGPTTPTTGATTTPDTTATPGPGDTGAVGSTATTPDAAAGSSDITAPQLSAGLEGLLSGLSELGIVDASKIKDSASIEDLLQLLADAASTTPDDASSTDTTAPADTPNSSLISFNTSPPVTPTPDASTTGSPVSPTDLLKFLASLAQLGSSLQALNTQPGATSAQPLSQTAQQVADVLAGKATLGSAGAQQGSSSDTQATGAPATLSPEAQQLLLVLEGLASLGSAGASQSTNNSNSSNSQSPTATELRQGLQSLITSLSASGLFTPESASAAGQSGSNTSSTNSGGGVTFDTSTGSTGGVTFDSGNREAINTISGNFFTDPEQMKIIQDNLRKALQTQQQQLAQASTLFSQSQEIVQKFVTIIKTDDLVKDVVHSDDLSDEVKSMFDDRMDKLRKDWGVDWGSDDQARTPAAQSNLVSRAVQSGTMV